MTAWKLTLDSTKQEMNISQKERKNDLDIALFQRFYFPGDLD